MVRLFALALASTALAGTFALALPEAAAAAQTSRAGKPQDGTFGFDVAGMDRSASGSGRYSW